MSSELFTRHAEIIGLMILLSEKHSSVPRATSFVEMEWIQVRRSTHMVSLGMLMICISTDTISRSVVPSDSYRSSWKRKFKRFIIIDLVSVWQNCNECNEDIFHLFNVFYLSTFFIVQHFRLLLCRAQCCSILLLMQIFDINDCGSWDHTPRH